MLATGYERSKDAAQVAPAWGSACVPIRTSQQSIGVAYDYRPHIVEGGGKVSELTAFWSNRLTQQWKLQVYGVVGFADASPDAISRALAEVSSSPRTSTDCGAVGVCTSIFALGGKVSMSASAEALLSGSRSATCIARRSSQKAARSRNG